MLCQLLVIAAGKRDKTCGIIVGLVPVISIRMAQCSIIGMAGTSAAMTKWAATSFVPLTAAARNARPYGPRFKRV